MRRTLAMVGAVVLVLCSFGAVGALAVEPRAELKGGATETGAPSGVDLPLFPTSHPLPDRWRIKPPPYDLNVEGKWYDPFNQNVLKGDFPIIGDDIFFRMTAATQIILENRSAPTPSGVSTADPGAFPFFGSNQAFIYDEKFALKLELFKGNTAFKPFDWQVFFEGVVDVNNLSVWENAAVSPDVRDGQSRFTHDAAIQQAGVEFHLADLSERYDFISMKLGRQVFNSDFRSLIFFDFNQGARLLGSGGGNRYQYNLVYFHMADKDAFSDLNTFDLRNQQVVIGNLYVQDFLFLGWQNQFSLHANFDRGADEDFVFDRAGFLVRPDPVGAAQPHDVDVYYLGWASEGHIGRLNVSHAFYQALGRDSLNPIAGRPVDINAQLAFLELSVDVDWMRYQIASFFTSGDDDPRDGKATGFDTILDFPRAMGGEFSYWNRQTVRIADRGGVALMQRNSLVPDLRSSKGQGQANFVNPGILMLNAGATFELTQKMRSILNLNYIRFVETEPLETLLKQPGIREDVGLDFSLGIEYRPLLSNNIIVKAFAAGLAPLGGFKDIYQSDVQYQVGTEILLVF